MFRSFFNVSFPFEFVITEPHRCKYFYISASVCAYLNRKHEMHFLTRSSQLSYFSEFISSKKKHRILVLIHWVLYFFEFYFFKFN